MHATAEAYWKAMLYTTQTDSNGAAKANHWPRAEHYTPLVKEMGDQKPQMNYGF